MIDKTVHPSLSNHHHYHQSTSSSSLSSLLSSSSSSSLLSSSSSSSLLSSSSSLLSSSSSLVYQLPKCRRGQEHLNGRVLVEAEIRCVVGDALVHRVTYDVTQRSVEENDGFDRWMIDIVIVRQKGWVNICMKQMDYSWIVNM